MEKVLGGCVCVCDGRSQIQRVTRHLGQIAHVIYLIKLSEPSTFFNPCTQICKVCLSGLILSIFCVRNGKVTRCFSSYGSIISGGKSHSSWKSRWIRSVGICSSQTNGSHVLVVLMKSKQDSRSRKALANYSLPAGRTVSIRILMGFSQVSIFIACSYNQLYFLQKADLLFVDYPVETCYSFVENVKNTTLFMKTDVEAVKDGTKFLIDFFNRNETLQKSPLYIVAESYGGKFAITLALSALKAIEAGKLKLNLRGVASGDSWISPEILSYFSWVPLLKDISFLDNNGFQNSIRMANQINKQIAVGTFAEAIDTWNKLEDLITDYNNNMGFDLILLSSNVDDPLSLLATSELKQRIAVKRSSPRGDGDLYAFMNGKIKKKLKIIPPNVIWGGQSGPVFEALKGDFMRPRISEVDELLTKGVNVTISNGQIIGCNTTATNAWLDKLKWNGMKNFLNKDRTPLYCEGDRSVKAFTKSYRNLHFYWILNDSRFVSQLTIVIFCCISFIGLNYCHSCLLGKIKKTRHTIIPELEQIRLSYVTVRHGYCTFFII
ncbi:unnamed protein product [Coffea canephora]|uniref:Carboxypeptidase n=1 Tax=Coffea canephora TaxID=49390 RepID=A0A068V1R0_COFCA|nr:unnamed protein product [Coffea canephora]